MYRLSIILDRSKKPKLTGIKNSQIIACILFLLTALVIPPMMLITTIGNYLSLDLSEFAEDIPGICLLVGTVGFICTRSLIYKSEDNYLNNNLVDGTVELTQLNGKEVGIFKSKYNEVIVIDFENVVRKGSRWFSKDTVKRRMKVKHKSTTVMYEGALIKCGILLYISDQSLINYMINRGYISDSNFESEDSNNSGCDD